MPDHADAKLSDVQLALATLTEAFAIALERHNPGIAADVLTVLQEGIEQLEELERDEARVMLLTAANRLAKVAGL